MNLKNYFEKIHGHGILATADVDGNVNVAEYAKPHFMDDGTIAFIMSHKRSYNNLQSNPQGAYIFIETGDNKESKSGGIRIYLQKIREDHDQNLIQNLRRKTRDNTSRESSLVFFEINNSRPLVGDGAL